MCQNQGSSDALMTKQVCAGPEVFQYLPSIFLIDSRVGSC